MGCYVMLTFLPAVSLTLPEASKRLDMPNTKDTEGICAGKGFMKTIQTSRVSWIRG